MQMPKENIYVDSEQVDSYVQNKYQNEVLYNNQNQFENTSSNIYHETQSINTTLKNSSNLNE